MTDLFARLAAPFPPQRVSWRVGPTTKDKTKGMALAYVDARDVMERLDAACGPAGWQNRYPHANGKTVCEIGVRVGDEWLWKADGAGDSEMEAEKGALSDAFKRAAVRWGIGRYLYDTPSPWVEIEQHGNSYSIKDSEKTRLAKLLAGSAAPVAQPQSPPVAAPAPAPQPTQAELDAFDALAAALGGVTTIGGMDTWRKLPESVDNFAKLGPRARAEFQHKMTAKREGLLAARSPKP